MTVGDRIKAAREACGMTQSALGKLCGVTKQTIFKYENNIITNIPLNKLKIISESLNVSAARLMGWETEDGGIDIGLADAYKIADPYDQFSVRKLLGLDTQNMEFQFAARKSDIPHHSTGPDTDVQI